MNGEHVISEGVFNDVLAAIAKGHTWLVYNTSSYYLSREDPEFFGAENEARTWIIEKYDKTDAWKAIYISSIADLYTEIKYGRNLETLLNNHPKTYFMNQQNLDYLKENLRYMGFGDKVNADLEKNMQQGFPEFVLKMHAEFSGQNLEANLFFRKSDQSDLYFFNKYDAVLRNDIGTFEHSFYLNKGHGVTLKEAFNLLQGRAVYKELENKEGQKYRGWIEIDFKEKENGSYKMKQYHDNYGYNLEATLQKFPIKDLANDQQKERLLSSLQRGNRQSVTMTVEGREQMFFLQANPQYKTVTIFDKGATRPLSSEQKVSLMTVTGEDRKKINGKVVTNGNGSTVKEIKNKGGEGAEKDKSQDNVQRNVVSEGKEKGVRAKGNKKEDVNNLLPQKQSNKPGKGLRA